MNLREMTLAEFAKQLLGTPLQPWQKGVLATLNRRETLTMHPHRRLVDIARAYRIIRIFDDSSPPPEGFWESGLGNPIDNRDTERRGAAGNVVSKVTKDLVEDLDPNRF